MSENKNKRQLKDQELEQATGGTGDGGQDRAADAVEDRVFDKPDSKVQKSGGDPYRPTT